MDKEQVKKFFKDNSLKIIVRPNANSSKIVKFDEDKKALRVDIAAPADKDKANKEVVKFFSKFIGKKVEIKIGLRSREKVLKICD